MEILRVGTVAERWRVQWHAGWRRGNATAAASSVWQRRIVAWHRHVIHVIGHDVVTQWLRYMGLGLGLAAALSQRANVSYNW